MAKVLLFGPLSDLAGWREREIDAPSVLALKAAIANDDAALGQALEGTGVQIAVNQMITRADVGLNQASEVAFLPPMSGG